MDNDYINGYVERTSGGVYQGKLTIDGITLEGGIEAMYFKQDSQNYLWLKRKALLEYDFNTQKYIERKREPQWEVYLEKQVNDNGIAYKGSFTFFKFKYSIIGIWDAILGKDKQRLNLYVERLPRNEQTIINNINKLKKETSKGHERDC